MTEINRTDFNYGGSIDGMKDISNKEIIEFAEIFKTRAVDKNYHMENDNFDSSIFLHRIWVLNYLLKDRGLNIHLITKIRKELQQEGLESAEYEHDLVHKRINALFNIVPQ